MSRYVCFVVLALEIMIYIPSIGSNYAKRLLLDNFPKSECRDSQADIMFLLDMSNKVGQQNFEHEKEFVQQVVDHISLGHEHYQVAVGTYSSLFHPNIDFHSSTNKTALESKIKDLPYIPGQRKINLALIGAEAGLISWAIGERPFAARVLFLVTSGESTAKYAHEALIASRLRNIHNISIFVIGVTPEANSTKVTGITADDKHYFYVDEFGKLQTLPDMLLNTLCHDVILNDHCFDLLSICPQLSCGGIIKDLQCPKTCGSCSGPSKPVSTRSWTSSTVGGSSSLPPTSNTQSVLSGSPTAPHSTMPHPSQVSLNTPKLTTAPQMTATPETTTVQQMTTTQQTTDHTSSVDGSTGDTPAHSYWTRITEDPTNHWSSTESKTTTGNLEWISVPYASTP